MLVFACKKPAIRATPPPPAAIAPWFKDVTEPAGLHFLHDAGPLGNYRFPEIMGSGAALLDYDNDGRLDIYLIQNGGPDSGITNRLYHQEPDGRFRDATEGSRLDVCGWGMGVAVGDFNNDGLPDVLVTEYGGIRLFLNTGGGEFREVTDDAGLRMPELAGGIRPWATAAAFADYDHDGWLDLVVTFYVAYDPARSCTGADGMPDYCGPHDFAGSVTRLFHNRGGHFEDVTDASGLGSAPAAGLGLMCLYSDSTINPSFFVANDGRPNQLWMNQGNGRFRDDADRRGVAASAAGQVMGNMGVAWGDTQGDGRFDLYVTHLANENNTFWRQRWPMFFYETTGSVGLLGHGQGTGFGAVLADFNNDGFADLAVVNGGVVRNGSKATEKDAPDLPAYWRGYAQRNQLFANQGQRNFADISAANPELCAAPNVGRALAFGCIFNDGAICLLSTSAGGPARLLRNTVPARGHWLIVRAVEPQFGGRDAYGAKITARAAGINHVGYVNPAGSYLSSNDPRVHLGLGAADSVEFIDVQWPDGTTETFDSLSANQIVTVRHGSGSKSPTAEP